MRIEKRTLLKLKLALETRFFLNQKENNMGQPMINCALGGGGGILLIEKVFFSSNEIYEHLVLNFL